MQTFRDFAEARCRVCETELGGPVLAVGKLPACNRFSSVTWQQDVRDLDVAECPACRLIQLVAPPPVEFVCPRVPWIRYNEPGGHLEDLAAALFDKMAKPNGLALGVGPFDEPLLTRLAQRGLRARQVDLLAGQTELHEAGFTPYLETLQARLRPEPLAATVSQHGPADLVVCRYLLEHSHDPIASFEGLAGLMAEDGLLLIEVPDSAKFLVRLDYSFLWEEHVSYFTEETLLGAVRGAGLEVEQLYRYEGALEDALVAVVRRPRQAPPSPRPGAVGDPSALFTAYRSSFSGAQQTCQARLRDHVAAGGRVAMIGIGHQAIMFINAMGLQPYISLMVDDDIHKKGCFAPGVPERIVSSAALLEDQRLTTCLLAASPSAELKIRQKLAPLLTRGVILCSIFASADRRSLLEEVA